MSEVYVVTSGEYSDYHIEAIYESRDAADAHVDGAITHNTAGEDEIQVEVWPLNKQLPFSGTVWRAQWFGKRMMGTDKTLDEWGFSRVYSFYHIGNDYGKASLEYAYDEDLTLSVVGSSYEHVVKAARDRIAHMKARRAGIT